MTNYTTGGIERKLSVPIKLSSTSTDVGMERKRSAGDIQGAGAVSEEAFRAAFIPTTSITVYSPRDLTETIGRVKDGLSVTAEEWEKRVEALKTLRSIVANGGTQYDEFFPLLKTLEVLVGGCIKDLRSSVAREACITVAYLSQELRTRFDRFAEGILPDLITLTANSAKIMASSAMIALRFILENTHSPRLLPILTGSMTLKSSMTRKCVCEFIEVVLRLWPVNVLEKHLGTIQDSLRRGIYDADQEARGFARRAFPSFAAKFPEQANSLLQNLDAQKRKLIEKDLINAGLNSLPGGAGGDLSRGRSNNPITRRPNKPVLGSAALNANTGHSRPPLTSQNEYSSVGRYVRQGSVVGSTDGRSRIQTRKNVTQSQPTSNSCSQCVVVGRTATTGLRIMPDTTSASWERWAPIKASGNDAPFTSVGTSWPGSAPATSREGSPSRYLFNAHRIGESPQMQTYNPLGYTQNGYPDRRPTGTGISHSSYNSGSRVPRSQGASREVSPARSVSSGYGGPISESTAFQKRMGNYSSIRIRPQNTSKAMSECGDITDASIGTGRHAFESDDNFSETSSQCSDRSGRSMPGYRRQHVTHFTSNLKEIFTQLTGAQWSDRKDGLVNLQNHMRSGNQLNPDEIRRLTDIFAKMFADSQSKVVSFFMDTLQFFIKEYNTMLRDWLYTLLIRLLHRQGSEVLGSHQKAIQETLFVVRSHFPLQIQFATCCRFIMDNTQTPNMKVKGCLLEYLKDLVLMMSPDMIVTTSNEVNTAVSRVISWSAEPKSADVRRMASRVIIKLFDLNSNSFASMLQTMPRGIQDRASEVLKTYQKTATGSGMSHLVDSAHTSPSWKASLSRSGSLRQRSLPHSSRSYMSRSIDQDSNIQQPSMNSTRLSPETMNNMIRQTTVDLQSLTTGIQQPGSLYPARRSSAGPAYQSQVSPDSRLGMAMPASAGATTNGASGVLRTMQPNNAPPSQLVAPSPSAYPYSAGLSDQQQYQLTDSARANKLGGAFNFDQGDGPKLKKPVIGYQTLKKIREMPPEDIFSEILQELSNHNERHEQRKTCMLNLIKLLRDGFACNWDEYFKPTLLILLETLGDDGSETRALALKVLQELVRTKPDLFHDFAYLFVIKILDACRDEEKSVIRSAEDCAKAVAQCLPPDLCFSVLTPLITDYKLQINLPAVKMQEHVVRHSSPDMVIDVLDAIVPGLIVACNHEDSAMRKASIFCLVAIAMKIGDAIWEHLTELHVSKKRLLKLYIDRELQTMHNNNNNGSNGTGVQNSPVGTRG